MREAMYDVKSEKPFLSDTLGKVCKGLILMSQSSGKVEILYRQLLHGILVARSIGNSRGRARNWLLKFCTEIYTWNVQFEACTAPVPEKILEFE